MRILDEFETLERCFYSSIARFGDGELRLAIGAACTSQRAELGLVREMRDMLANPRNMLVGIPYDHKGPKAATTWRTYAQPRFTRLYTAPLYGSAFITRPDSAPWIDTPDYWKRVRDLWRDKDVTLVVGDKKSLTRELLEADGATVREVWGPRQHAYAEIGRLEEEIGKPSGVVILCLGACATALAARLDRKNVHALDLGHMGMFMRHAGAYHVQTDELASSSYRAVLVQKHRATKWGRDGHSHAPEILDFAHELGATTVLDYGCGRGTLKPAISPTLKVAEYDPGIAGKDGLPKPAELVVATDVLEHIEPERLDAVLQHLFNLAGKGVYLVISLREAREILPDGRNAHLIVEGVDWWLKRLRAMPWRILRHEKRKGLNVWIGK